MKIAIRNYRGIEEAEIDLERIALIAGPNGSGKTSIAQAVAAALTDTAVVMDGVNKGDAGLLLRDGAKRGRCTITSAEGVAAVNWPGASTTSEGTPPKASPIASGLVSIATMKPKDATMALIAATGATPTRDQLAAAIAEAELPETLVKPVWDSIEENGWDAAHARAKEKGTRTKGAWEGVTGERYGAARAASWQAPGTPGSVDGLEQLLEEQEGALEAAIASQAVGRAEVEALQQAVADGAKAAEEAGRLKAELDAARKHEQDLSAERKALPDPVETEEGVPCAHCSKPLVIDGGTLRKPGKGQSAATNAKRREKIEAAAQALQAASLRTAEINSKLVLANSKAEIGRRAETRLQQMDLDKDGTTPEQVQAARDAVAATRAQILAAAKNLEAAGHAAKVEQIARLVEILAPTGLRQAAMSEAIGTLNADLADICQDGDWPVVQVEPDARVTVGGRPFALVAVSEQFRAQVALQVAIAERDGSDALVIDAADILDRKGRNGLFNILRTTGIPALVTMTFSDRADVPSLAGAEIGDSYWIGGGYAARLVD